MHPIFVEDVFFSNRNFLNVDIRLLLSKSVQLLQLNFIDYTCQFYHLLTADKFLVDFSENTLPVWWTRDGIDVGPEEHDEEFSACWNMWTDYGGPPPHE